LSQYVFVILVRPLFHYLFRQGKMPQNPNHLPILCQGIAHTYL